jgi:hypothetical protein
MLANKAAQLNLSGFFAKDKQLRVNDKMLAPRLLRMLYKWLDCSDSASKADLIFALAGRPGRKKFALETMAAGLVPKLLLSVGRFELRSFGELSFPVPLNLPRIAAEVPPERRHFFVYLENSAAEVEFIPKRYLGTLTEIGALASWVRRHGQIRSVLIASSPTHLRRVRMCCRVLLPPSLELRFLAVAAEDPCLQPDLWWRSERTRFVVLSEFPKLLLYWVVLHFARMTGNSEQLRDLKIRKIWYDRATNT